MKAHVIPGRTLGRYRILEQIGAGGMGIVFRAHDLRLERDIALKVLPPGRFADQDARQRFRREALALSRLSHAGIATVFDFDTYEDVDFLVVELIPGVGLDERLAGGPLPHDEVLRLGVQLADALEGAHQDGVVHRDLKPGNLRVTPAGRLKLLDFGLAKLLEPRHDLATVTGTDTLAGAGTLPYMAPEQLRGGVIDARTDIWAAGAVLYEMATAARAFPFNSPGELVDAILHAPFAARHPLVEPLPRVILTCLEQRPQQRYQTAGELREALQRDASVPRRTPAARRSPRQRIRSLAVLPLVNIARDGEKDYIADGMMEALITTLAKIRSIRVISRTSAMLYKGTAKPLPQIARELNVDALVEGSVLCAGGTVRITAQLVHAATDTHVWGDTYEGPDADVLGLHARVARAVAHEITPQVTPRPRKPANSAAPGAQDAYLRGRFWANQYSVEGLSKAVSLFEQAIALDPRSAVAHAGLAEMYSWAAYIGTAPPRDLYPRAIASAAQALALDDTLSEAHLSMGYAQMVYEWNWPRAGAEFLRALEISPSSAAAHFNYSLWLSATGQVKEGIAQAKRGRECDPLSLLMNVNVGWRYMDARQYDRASVWFRQTLDMNPGFDVAIENLARTHVFQGHPADAVDLLERAGRESLPVTTLATLALALATSGRVEEALEIEAMLARKADEAYVSPFWRAVISIGLGRIDEAFTRLEQGLDQRDSWLVFLKVSPLVDPLRPDPRFPVLLERTGLSA
jgi:eukaryotic-like serine/threonine-protein kinase